MDYIEELDSTDEELERLEEIRRRGIPSITVTSDGNGDDDDDVDPYYTLPPSRVDIMEDWQEWRMVINDLMIDTACDKEDFGAKREILTASGEAKTPDFFLGKNFIHGNRVKDEYGGEAITETDDNKTKEIKKIMEENFYLFGIPRLSVSRCSSEVGSGSRRSSITTSRSWNSSHSADERRESFHSSGENSSSTETDQPKTRHYSLGSKPKKSKLSFFKKKFLNTSEKPPLPPRRRFSTGNAWIHSFADN